ncbi:hypothetical protein CEXT_541591 [Caerostris extrusa]|uniref:Uncharacterized protein n=1 Tax=Caerostris extrusa TaxID=172846 RepID=A0AAV4UNT0_CAEEX|nr:hypothetical protein CEXT_541591 [Caerostris extrusa]
MRRGEAIVSCTDVEDFTCQPTLIYCRESKDFILWAQTGTRRPKKLPQNYPLTNRQNCAQASIWAQMSVGDFSEACRRIYHWFPGLRPTITVPDPLCQVEIPARILSERVTTHCYKS